MENHPIPNFCLITLVNDLDRFDNKQNGFCQSGDPYQKQLLTKSYLDLSLFMLTFVKIIYVFYCV